jgi:hypothetical protein
MNVNVNVSVSVSVVVGDHGHGMTGTENVTIIPVRRMIDHGLLHPVLPHKDTTTRHHLYQYHVQTNILATRGIVSLGQV